MLGLKATSYEEMRLEYFRKQRDSAKRRMNYWCGAKQADRVGWMEASDRASEAGMQYNFYKDALEALDNNKFQYETGFVKGFEAARPKWISAISEHPEDQAVVLIYCNDGEVGAARFEEEYGCFVTTEKGTWKGAYGAVTHWMPLPEPPKEEA